MTTLPTDSADRKNYPIHRGVLRYFPAALAGVARISKIGNDKHNPGEEMHHARGKSSDHADCILRHMIDLEDLLQVLAVMEQSTKYEAEIIVEKIKGEASNLCWRALALSQEIHERLGAPLAPGAKLSHAAMTTEAVNSALHYHQNMRDGNPVDMLEESQDSINLALADLGLGEVQNGFEPLSIKRYCGGENKCTGRCGQTPGGVCLWVKSPGANRA